MMCRRGAHVAVCAAVALTALVMAEGAAATRTGETPGQSALWQYTETVPTSTGGGSESNQATVAPLPPSAHNRLDWQTSPVDRVLHGIATSASYGAPRDVESAAQATGASAETLPTPSTAAIGGRAFAVVSILAGTLLAALAYRLFGTRRDRFPASR